MIPAWSQDTAHLFPIFNDGKLGFIDINGHEVIKPQFEARTVCFSLTEWPEFSEGLAPAGSARKSGHIDFGYIDRTGKFVIPPEFASAGLFHDGVAVVRTWLDPAGPWEGGPAWINKEGNRLFTGGVKDAAFSFHDGLMPRQSDQNGLWGYVGTKFQWVIPPQFSRAREFSEGLALVQHAGSENGAFIDRTGQPVIDLSRYGSGRQFFDYSDGFARFAKVEQLSPDSRKLGPWGFIDRSGKEVMPPVFQEARQFTEGHTLVRNGRDWLIIDKNGATATTPDIEVGPGFAEGFSTARNFKRGTKGYGDTGFVDPTGAWVIAPQFWSAESFLHGLARVYWLEGEFGYINKRGELVWKGKCRAIPPA